MNKKFLPYHTFKEYSIEQLNKFIHTQHNNTKYQYNKNDALINKPIKNNHSKSLYYYKNFNSKTNQLRKYQKNKINSKIDEANRINYTINQQILCPEQKKPATQECRSGRNAGQNNKKITSFDTRNNKISLRSSSHYTKLISVAGIPLNQKMIQDRKQNHLNTMQNLRKLKQKQLQRQNQRLSKKLDIKQSQYSSKKLLKSYQTQQKILKRLTSSKLSQRSKNSILSNKSDRSSLCSKSSRNSSRSSLKSTTRSGTQGFNRFQNKLQTVKKVKIIQHNIHKANQNQLNKFRSLFANSFNSIQKKQEQENKHKLKHKQSIRNNLFEKNHQKIMLRDNPYADIEVLSHKSNLSQNGSKKNLHPKSSTKKLDYQTQKNRISNSVMPSFGNLLHKIAEEMYNKDNNENQELQKDHQRKTKPGSQKLHRNHADKRHVNPIIPNKYSILSLSTNEPKI